MEKLRMNEKKKYEIIKKWSEGLITFKRAQLKLGYTEQHMYRLKKSTKKKAKMDSYMVIEAANPK